MAIVPFRKPKPNGRRARYARRARRARRSGNALYLILGLSALGYAIYHGYTDGMGGRGSGGPFWADRDCRHFATQAEAQRFYEMNKPGDRHNLDMDGDGRACDWLD